MKKILFTIIAIIASVLAYRLMFFLPLLIDNSFNSKSLMFVPFFMIALAAACFALATGLVFMKKKYAVSSDESDKPSVKKILVDNVAVIAIVIVAIAVFMVINLTSLTSLESTMHAWFLLTSYALMTSVISVLVYNIIKMKRVKKSV